METINQAKHKTAELVERVEALRRYL